jgi:hypothetical protein
MKPGARILGEPLRGLKEGASTWHDGTGRAPFIRVGFKRVPSHYAKITKIWLGTATFIFFRTKPSPSLTSWSGAFRKI